MPEPTQVRRSLGAELKALRTMAGETQRAFADRTKFIQVQVTRVENGQQLLSVPDVTAWLDAFETQPEVKDRILALASAAHYETMPWPDSNEGATLQGVAADREETSSYIRNFQRSWLPGLMQTAEYARQLMPQTYDATPESYAAALAARMERQHLLYGDGRRFEFLLAEEMLLWAPGPRIMAAQLAKVLTVATLTAVEVRVLPSRREGAAVGHSFIIYTPIDGQPDYVTTELLHGGGVLRSPDTVALYERLWKQLWDAALGGDDAIELIRRIG